MFKAVQSLASTQPLREFHLAKGAVVAQRLYASPSERSSRLLHDINRKLVRPIACSYRRQTGHRFCAAIGLASVLVGVEICDDQGITH